MSSINTFSYGTGSLGSLFQTQNSRWRGGVIGWEKKAEKSNSSSSASGMSSGASDYVTNVKTFATNINTALASLTGKNQASVFDMLKGTSSDEKAVSVSVNDQKKASALADKKGTKALEVKQLASAQKNSGDKLSSSAINSVDSGNNFFSIKKDGKAFQFNISVNSTDSNRTVQEKMAASINRQAKDTGITASVVYNEKDKTSSLVLESKETGKDEAFEIKDENGGNLVSETGADNIQKEAKDAMYTLDGDLNYSSKNEADLGDGLTATFNKTTEDEVTVGAKGDTEKITQSIYDLVNGFNQLRETAADANSDSGAKSLQDRLDSLTSAYGATLKRVGISLNGEGYMQLDKDAMNKAIENGQAESVLGEDSGFTRSLSSVTSSAEKDPTRYLSYEARTGKDTEKYEIDYDELLANTSFSPFQSMQLTQWENTGMLLNALI